MIEREPGTDWRDLQRRVAAILRECGLHAEVEKTVMTARGTVEVDVWALDPTTTPPALYFCECKRWTASVPQGEVQAFRTAISDAGSHHGLFISASGFQKGAHDVARHSNVSLVSWPEFQEMFIERWCGNFWIPTFRTQADRLAAYADPSVSSAAAADTHRDRPLMPEEAIGLMALSTWSPTFVPSPFDSNESDRPLLRTAIWQLRDRYRQYLPAPAADAEY